MKAIYISYAVLFRQYKVLEFSRSKSSMNIDAFYNLQHRKVNMYVVICIRVRVQFFRRNASDSRLIDCAAFG